MLQPPTSANASGLSNVVSENPQSNIIKSKTATNISQGVNNASATTARPGDQISYTIKITNSENTPLSTKLEDNVSDILDYSTIIDNGGGTLDNTTSILYWPSVTLSPNDTQTRTFIVKLLDSIPPTAQGTINPMSYDCIMTNVFGDLTNIDIDCPAPKIVEKVVMKLPKAGPTENIIFTSIILMLATYFFARSRQLEKEIHIIRRNANAGTL
jgi:uncharacterized repeat protein (TIGR01451 family)